MSQQLHDDLTSMVGVWREYLAAYSRGGTPLSNDDAGGVPGPFPYENLVYVDFDGHRYTQTNVVLSGRQPDQRTFTATVADGVFRFDHLGPDAPTHMGVSGGPGLIWFVAERITDVGVSRYSEPDLIRIEGDRRWRNTALWRDGKLTRLLAAEGVRLSTDTAIPHELDPRGAGSPVHGTKSVTHQYEKPVVVE